MYKEDGFQRLQIVNMSVGSKSGFKIVSGV